jgi:hypothetical protein
MKKCILKFIAVVTMVVGFLSVTVAQSFEGTIEFKKASSTDTTNYVYYIKGAEIRIDEIGTQSHKAEGTFLVDMEGKTMKSLNHERKLYMDQPTPPAPVSKGTFTVKKGTEVKNLQGYKCVQYTVTNTEEGTQIVYWLAEGKFSFFIKLLHQLNRKDKSSIYFLQIPDTKNMFPMLSIQQDLEGKEQMRLEVTKIIKKEIDPSMFELPKGYSKFEK